MPTACTNVDSVRKYTHLYCVSHRKCAAVMSLLLLCNFNKYAVKFEREQNPHKFPNDLLLNTHYQKQN